MAKISRDELKKKGYTIGIITWLSKNATRRYQNMVRNAKIRYINKYFNGIFDEIHVIQYGKNKNQYAENGYILFDDEENNRIQWEKKNGISYNVNNIIDILTTLWKCHKNNKISWQINRIDYNYKQ